jgi:acyl carrier protein
MGERLNAILKAVFDLNDSDLKEDLPKEGIPKWDSLTHMDLITCVEREFGIQLTIEDIIRMVSLDAIRTVVKEKRNGYERKAA